MIMAVWFYVFPVLIAVVIALNRWTQWPHSWGLGAFAQAGQMVIAALYGDATRGLWLSALPFAFFMAAWWTAIRKRKLGKDRSPARED
jgi:hypothetical protein